MVWATLVQDARYAVRGLRRDAGFFMAAVLIVGLGVGATTSIFSVVNALVLRGLPFRDPARLAWVANTGRTSGLSAVTLRTSVLRDFRRYNRSFDGLAGYMAFFDYEGFTLTGNGMPERLVGVGVTHDFLQVLGVQPLHGRGFAAEEALDEGRPAVILTHGFWTRRFAADPRIIGTTLALNGQPTPVVGVLPASFDFTSVFAPASRVDLLVPFPVSDLTDRMGNTMAVVGRLKPGISIEQAQADLTALTERLKQENPGRRGRWGARVTGLTDQVVGRYRRALAVLAGAVGLVLLIACSNLANLLLARGTSRRKEVALRSALGAGRGRLIAQFVTESLLLSASGALLGVVVALGLTRAVASASAVTIPMLATVRVDLAALGFTLGVAVVTGLVVGLVPALQASGSQDFGALNDAGRGSTDGRGHHWIRSALVAGEVALACVLLVGAGLLLRSFVTLLDTDLGFQPAGAAAWRIETGRQYRDYAARQAFYERILGRVRAIPGVRAAGLTDALPLGRNRSWGIAAKGVVYRDDQRMTVFPRLVDPAYRETMRIPLVEGRDLSPFDTTTSERVAVLNETAAGRLWPGESAIGRTALIGGNEFRVVGVVGDVRHRSLEEDAGLEAYLAITQADDWDSLDLVVRSDVRPETLGGAVRQAVQAIDPTVPAADMRTLEGLVDRAVSPRRFTLLLIGAFAAVALGLAALGIYGVVSYSVTRRAHEIGIRMALGASAASVQATVVGGTLALAGAGVAAGLSAALALSRLLTSLLYGVSPSDPITLAGMASLLLAFAALASYLPARRASRIDPMTTLRST